MVLLIVRYHRNSLLLHCISTIMIIRCSALSSLLSLLFQSKLASLAAEAQTAQSASTSSFEWRNIKVSVSSEKIRVPLHSAAELASTLETAMDTGETPATTPHKQ